MPGIINSSSFAKDLWPGVRTWFGLKYKEYPIEYLDLFEKNSSSLAFEEEVSATGFGLAAVKTESGSISYDSATQGFVQRYTHITYGLGFMITKEMYDDGISVTASFRRANALAFSVRQTKEIIGANVYNRAHNTSYTMGSQSDNLPLCYNAHLNKTGGTWSNTLTPAADLSESALEQACINIAALTNDRGLLIALRPQKLIIPPSLEFEAIRLLKSEFQPGTANNDVNAIRVLGKFPKGIIVNHYLTDTNNWFIQTDCPDGMKYFERRADSFDMDNDFDTENAKFKATFRCSFGWTDARNLYSSAPA